MISTCQPVDQHLRVVSLAPVSQLISTCQQLISDYQPLDQHLSTTISAPVSRLNSACQPLHQCLSAAGSLPSQLRNQRLLSHESAPTQPRDHSLSASLSEPVIRLISTCQQVEECLLSCANCISQPVDLRLLSPAISTYSAA